LDYTEHADNQLLLNHSVAANNNVDITL